MRIIFLLLFAALLSAGAQAAPLTQKFQQIYPGDVVMPSASGPATVSWPSTSPIVAPGVMCINYLCYDTSAGGEGLMTFTAFDPNMTLYPSVIYRPYHSSGNLIVVNTTSPDVRTFIASVNRLIGYGSADKGLTTAQRKYQMRSRIVWLQCGDTSDLLISMLGDIGVQARRVHLLSRSTAATQTGLDDGHVGVEVRIDGVWQYFDPSLDGYYTDGTNQLSAIGLHDFGMVNATYERQAPTEFTGGDIYSNTLVSGGTPPVYATYFSIRNWVDQNLSTPAKVEAWRNRIYGVYGWAHPSNGEIWWLDDGLTTDEKNWITGLSSSYKIKTRVQIEAQFYP